MSVKVTIRNKDRLARKLQRLAPEVQRAMASSNAETAREMVSTAKQFAPVGETGRLQASIRAEHVGGETDAVRVMAGGSTTTRAARGGKGSYDYALGMEFGTSDTTAQPFFFPSYRLAAKKHRGRVTRAVNKIHKQIASR